MTESANSVEDLMNSMRRSKSDDKQIAIGWSMLSFLQDTNKLHNLKESTKAICVCVTVFVCPWFAS